MFEILSFDEIFKGFETRNNQIKKLDKIPIEDSNYLKFIKNFTKNELNADLEIFDYETALNQNNYLIKNYLELSNSFWILGRSGQGDEWFINKSSGTILFYDHNQGEYEEEKLLDLNIDFLKFIQLGSIIGQLENYLADSKKSGKIFEEYKKIISRIHLDLYVKYPYKYF